MSTFENIPTTIIDYEKGLARFMGRTELYKKFLTLYPLDETYIEFLQAMEASDYETALKAAHALKGSSGNLSLAKIYQNLDDLIGAFRHEDTEKIMPLFEETKASYEETCAVIASLAENQH